MSTWKREGRNAIRLMLLMVQTLLIVKGVGATSILASSVANSAAVAMATSAVALTSSPAVAVDSSAAVTPMPDKSSYISPSASVSASQSAAAVTATPSDSLATRTVSTTSTKDDATTTVIAASSTESAPVPTTSVLPPIGTPAPHNKTDSVEVFVLVYFSMPWGRLCYLLTLFREALSQDLIEFSGDGLDIRYARVIPNRIKLMNANEKCTNTTYYNDEAVLQFYVSNSENDIGVNDTNKMTIKAFTILYRYWVDKTMILLDKVFEGKVERVELIGADAKVDKYTEAERIGIGIGVALAVVVLILLILFCLRGYKNVKSVGRKPEENRMVFANTLALNEEASDDAGNAGDAGDAGNEYVIRPQPPVKVQDEMPFYSTIKDYEDGQKAEAGRAPLAKPEPDNVSEGEPIKSSDEPEGEPIKSSDEPEGEPIKSPEPEIAAAPEEARPISEPEKPPETEDETFTSSVTIIITPDAATPATFEFPVAETGAPEPAKKDDDKQASVDTDDDVKPDFGQSDNVDVDPNQGAINMGFDIKDEAPKEVEEETKF